MESTIKPNQIKAGLLLIFIAAVAASRVWVSSSGNAMFLSNFSAIGAMALFGGAYFTRVKSFAFPLLALWIGDILLNKFVFYGEWRLFYDGFYWTYGAFALMVVVGKYLLKKVTVANYFGATLTIVFIHWIVTDFGVWISGVTYPLTWSGWVACLVAAIPYELNLLLGTLFYGAVMFGSVEWFKVRYPELAYANA